MMPVIMDAGSEKINNQEQIQENSQEDVGEWGWNEAEYCWNWA